MIVNRDVGDANVLRNFRPLALPGQIEHERLREANSRDHYRKQAKCDSWESSSKHLSRHGNASVDCIFSKFLKTGRRLSKDSGPPGVGHLDGCPLEELAYLSCPPKLFKC